MSEELTQELKQELIDNAHDSVIIINQLKAKGNLIPYEDTVLANNIQNLTEMLAKDWFVEILKPEEKIKLESLIQV